MVKIGEMNNSKTLAKTKTMMGNPDIGPQEADIIVKAKVTQEETRIDNRTNSKGFKETKATASKEIRAGSNKTDHKVDKVVMGDNKEISEGITTNNKTKSQENQKLSLKTCLKRNKKKSCVLKSPSI